MPTRFLLHTTLLVASTLGVYFWLTIPSLAPFTLQLVAVLVLLYLGSHALKSHRPTWFHRSTIPLDLTILTSMILLLVSETGSLASPFFFLCYFLLFAVAMLYEIEATILLTGVRTLFFLFVEKTTLSGPVLSNVEGVEWGTQIISLIMITPLAIFTGHSYESKLTEERQLAREETDTLTFLSLNLKRTLVSALDTLSLTIPQTQAKNIRANLQTLYEDLKNLYRSADELESTIDQETDH